jgi:hypothetical protein
VEFFPRERDNDDAPFVLFPCGDLLPDLGESNEKSKAWIRIIGPKGIGWSTGINQIPVRLKSKFGFIPLQPNEP